MPPDILAVLDANQHPPKADRRREERRVQSAGVARQARDRHRPARPPARLGSGAHVFGAQAKQPGATARQAVGPAARPGAAAADDPGGARPRQPAGQRARRHLGVPPGGGQPPGGRRRGRGRGRVHAGGAGAAGPQPRRGRQRAEPGVRGAGQLRAAARDARQHQPPHHARREPGAGHQHADWAHLGQEEAGRHHHGVVYRCVLFGVLVLSVMPRMVGDGCPREKREHYYGLKTPR